MKLITLIKSFKCLLYHYVHNWVPINKEMFWTAYFWAKMTLLSINYGCSSLGSFLLLDGHFLCSLMFPEIRKLLPWGRKVKLPEFLGKLYWFHHNPFHFIIIPTLERYGYWNKTEVAVVKNYIIDVLVDKLHKR